MRRAMLFAALAAAILSPTPAVVASEMPPPGPLLVVLEHPADSRTEDADQVAVLDPASLSVIGRAPVDARRILAFDRDGRHLIAWGTSGTSAWTGKATDPATLEIYDLVDHRIDTTFTLFPRAFRMLDGEHGRFFALTFPGEHEVDPTPRTLLAIDLVGRREIGRVLLGKAAERVKWERADDLLYLLVGTDDEGRKALPARLLVYDAAQARVIQETTLSPRPLGVFRLGDYVYAVCQGSGKKEKGAHPGKVYVFDATSHALLAEHHVGFEPALVRLDPVERSLLVLARGEDKTGPGSLTELTAHLVRAQAAVPGDVSDLLVAGGSDTLYLLAPRTVVELGRRDLATIHRYRLPFEPIYVVSDTRRRRAFVGASPGPFADAATMRGSEIAILDRAAGTLVASIRAGRFGVKFGRSLVPVEVSRIYFPGPSNTGVVLSEDGKRLFVANVQSNDVTVIDLEEAKVLEMLRVGTNPYLMFIPTATSLLWVLSSEHVTRIDTGTLQQLDFDLSVKEGLIGWPFLDSGSERVFVPHESDIEVLSAKDGSRIAMIEGLDHPVGISAVPRIAIALPDPAPAAGEALPPRE